MVKTLESKLWVQIPALSHSTGKCVTLAKVLNAPMSSFSHASKWNYDREAAVRLMETGSIKA